MVDELTITLTFLCPSGQKHKAMYSALMVDHSPFISVLTAQSVLRNNSLELHRCLGARA